MDALDLLDVDYVVDTNSGPYVHKDSTTYSFEGMKILVGDELYVATEATNRLTRCDHCHFTTRNLFGVIHCLLPQKPFLCSSKDRDFYLIAANTYKEA